MPTDHKLTFQIANVDHLRRDQCDDEYHALGLAVKSSTRSPCLSKRGAVIWCSPYGGLVASGWNHQPSGFECTADATCKATCRRTAIHAEEMAIMNTHRESRAGMNMLHVKTVGGMPVPSGPPSCIRCSGLIAEVRIKWMWLLHEQGLRAYSAREFHELTLRNYAVRPGETAA